MGRNYSGDARGVTVGDNSIIGTSAVLTRTIPENAVVGGVPARVIRMRDAPSLMRYEAARSVRPYFASGWL